MCRGQPEVEATAAGVMVQVRLATNERGGGGGWGGGGGRGGQCAVLKK